MTTSDLPLLEGALQGEYFGISAYDAALGLGVLGEGSSQVARAFQDDHRQHADLLKKEISRLGATPSEPKSWGDYAAAYPPPALETEMDVLNYAASLELAAAAADAEAVAKLASPELRSLFTRIGSIESMHLALLRQAVGENPVPGALLPEPSR